jgi:hypothetical protein
VVDAYGANSSVAGQEYENRAQGMYADGVQGLLLEENVFDHNGWNGSVAGAGPNKYSQNIYLNTLNTGVQVIGNVIAEPSGHGLQARAGGIVKDNLFLDCPFGLSFGYINTSPVKEGGVSGEVSGNVFYGSRDVPWDEGEWVMDIANTAPGGHTAIHDNLAVGTTSGDKPAIRIRVTDNPSNPTKDVGLNDLTVARNTVYGWSHGLETDATFVPGGTGHFALNGLTVRDNDFQATQFAPVATHGTTYSASAETWSGNRYDAADPSGAWFAIPGKPAATLADWQAAVEPTASAVRLNYADPTRSAASYNGSLGGAPTTQALLAGIRAQSKAKWQPQYTARAVEDYLRAGFTVVGSPASSG